MQLGFYILYLIFIKHTPSIWAYLTGFVTIIYYLIIYSFLIWFSVLLSAFPPFRQSFDLLIFRPFNLDSTLTESTVIFFYYIDKFLLKVILGLPISNLKNKNSSLSVEITTTEFLSYWEFKGYFSLITMKFQN